MGEFKTRHWTMSAEQSIPDTAPIALWGQRVPPRVQRGNRRECKRPSCWEVEVGGHFPGRWGFAGFPGEKEEWIGGGEQVGCKPDPGQRLLTNEEEEKGRAGSRRAKMEYFDCVFDRLDLNSGKDGLFVM
ncbi:hypothetical protein KIL84_004366 [Mauremys mutica]|uniref:Uncharacterized protein n=1 Tax=Mauremys mutica TaxID=74926 RepID=A0A9D3XJZ1_9SAUR|nr:hypothetical protein KIL84_004366 [Mauremys mutica]